MIYLPLSYDHCLLLDGRDAVPFLKIIQTLV
jgi:pyruvate/2-oxoglutarate dehydrogenase complex dihydrolipoamide acyltransferase (E2) component